MGQADEYKSSLESILLELELSLPNRERLEKSKEVAKHVIEVEIEKCRRVLDARRQALLAEVELKFQTEEKQLANVLTAIAACKEALQAGSRVYNFNKEAAQQIWMGAAKLHPAAPSLISISFPASLGNISKLGSVEVKTSPSIPLSFAGPVTTLAGSTKGYVDGDGSNAQFNDTRLGYFNSTDKCFYVSDSSNDCIRKVTEQGVVTTFANSIKEPRGIAYYQKENCFFVCSFSHKILKVTASGVVSTFAGSGHAGSEDGVGATASFNKPRGIAVDQISGNLFITDMDNHKIRKVTQKGEVSTLAGTGHPGFSDGIGKAASFGQPYDICFDGDLVICDTDNNRVRRLSLQTGEVTTLREIQEPFALTVTPHGSFILAAGHAIVLLSQIGTRKYNISSIAGSGEGYADGAPLEARFNAPTGVSFDPATNTCFVVDRDRIRTLTLI